MLDSANSLSVHRCLDDGAGSFTEASENISLAQIIRNTALRRREEIRRARSISIIGDNSAFPPRAAVSVGTMRKQHLDGATRICSIIDQALNLIDADATSGSLISAGTLNPLPEKK